MEHKIGVLSLWPGHRSHHSSKGSVLFLTSWWAEKGEYMPNVRRDTPEGSWHHFTLNIRKDWRGCVGEGEGGGGGGREHPTPILLQTSGPCLWTRVGPVRRGYRCGGPTGVPWGCPKTSPVLLGLSPQWDDTHTGTMPPVGFTQHCATRDPVLVAGYQI